MFERKSEPLAKPKVFYKRLITFFLLGFSMIVISLGIGTIGYMRYGKLDFTDGFYNASMILTGMGPDVQDPTEAVKIFAALYAIYSGVIFLSSITIIFAPIVHRFFHVIHMDEND